MMRIYDGSQWMRDKFRTERLIIETYLNDTPDRIDICEYICNTLFCRYGLELCNDEVRKVLEDATS